MYKRQLKASPYGDNTIVVFWSDHGYHHGEKGDWGKHTLWERTSNVPFIWAGPGVAEGARTDVTVSLIDMYPTLVEMCGLPKPRQELEGESLASTLSNPPAATDRNVFLPHMHPGEYAIINRQWRYIRYGEDGEELYDLKEIPMNGTTLHPTQRMLISKRKCGSPHQRPLPRRKASSIHERTLWLKARPFAGRRAKGTTRRFRNTGRTLLTVPSSDTVAQRLSSINTFTNGWLCLKILALLLVFRSAAHAFSRSER